jgi:recombination endonuclease VII
MSKLRHGTTSGYKHYKCRCVLCSEAYSKYMKDYRAKVRLKPITEHGTHSSYFYRGCRCELCAQVPRQVYAAKSEEAKKQTRLKSVFGISLEQYNTMLDQQNGVCAVCKKPESRVDSRTKKINKLAVHHNHITGKVIALCCSQCNIGMGNLRDSYTLLMRAAELMKGEPDEFESNGAEC